MKFLIICLKLAFLFGSLSLSALAVQENDLLVLNSEQMLAEFESQLEWFSVHQKSFLEENEEWFRELGEWKEACEYQAKAKREIDQSKKEFIIFRDRFVEHLNVIACPSSYTAALIENAQNKITLKYIELMQDCLFPEKWEEAYEDYLKELSYAKSSEE